MAHALVLDDEASLASCDNVNTAAPLCNVTRYSLASSATSSCSRGARAGLLNQTPVFRPMALRGTRLVMTVTGIVTGSCLASTSKS